MSAAADDMEAALAERAKTAITPSDDMELALLAQSQTKAKTPDQISVDKQSNIRSTGDAAGLGAGEYVYDWAKGIWNTAKNYATKKGDEIKKTGTTSNTLDDLAKAASTGLYNSTIAPLFGAGAKIGGAISGTGTTYEQGKQAAMINPSDNTAAAGDVIGAATKPVGEIMSAPGNIAGSAAEAAGASPDTQSMVKDVTNVAAPLAVSRVAKVVSNMKAPAMESAQSVLNKEASAQSAGSAGAAIDLSKQSPEFIQNIQKRVDKGETLNPKAVAAQALGDRLPVKMTFTEGQALEDADKISNERNARGVNPEIATARINEQNKQLVGNLQAAKEKYGENDFTSNHIDRGQKFVNGYEEYDAAKEVDIGAKYKALEDAAQGSNPIDPVGVYNDTVNKLQAKLKLTRAQQIPEFNELKQLAEAGTMTFDNYHTLIQDLGKVIAGGGNEASAAKIIQDSLAKMPLKPEAAALRNLRDQASQAAKSRFDELAADKAYSDVVNGKIQPDHFLDKYITGNANTVNRAQIDAINKKFGNDPAMKDALNTAIIERLRKEAGIDESGKGDFSQAKYNKYYQSIEPKIRNAVAPDMLESLSDIGEAARLAKQLPSGHTVNTSNTTVVAMANAAKSAENMRIPYAGVVSKGIEKYAQHKAKQDLKKSFEYGAGISQPKKLSEILNPKPKKDPEKK